MPARSRTSEFREVLKEKQNDLPDVKRRKLNAKRTATDSSQRDGQNLLGKEYLTEAYVVVCGTCKRVTCMVVLTIRTVEPHQHTDPNAIRHSEALLESGLAQPPTVTAALTNYRSRRDRSVMV